MNTFGYFFELQKPCFIGWLLFRSAGIELPGVFSPTCVGAMMKGHP